MAKSRRAAVEVVSGDDFIPGLQGHEDGVHCSQSAGKGQAVVASFQGGKGGLESVRVGLEERLYSHPLCWPMPSARKWKT